MRTIRDLRLAGLIATIAAMVLALLAAYLFHALLGKSGRLGWGDFNFFGILEGLVFALVYTIALLGAKRAAKVSTTTLLSSGIFLPTSARKLAKKVPTMDSASSLEVDFGVLIERGAPVGVIGIKDSMVAWEECAVVAGDIAAADLSHLFNQHRYVFVADGNVVHGVISRETFLKYLGV